MQVTFTSVDDQMNRVQFSTPVEQLTNGYQFKDESMDQTMLTVLIEEDCIHFIRTGQVDMTIVFDRMTTTIGSYKNTEGLEFQFLIHCKRLLISSKQIIIHYDMILDEKTKSKHKISLHFKG